MAKTVKSGAELRAATEQKTAQLQQTRKDASSQVSSQTSSQPRQTVRSGEELRQMTYARQAQLQKAEDWKKSGVATYNPSNTYDAGKMGYYLTHTEKQYNQANAQQIKSDFYERANNYFSYGSHNDDDSYSFYQEALQHSQNAMNDDDKAFWDAMADNVKSQMIFDINFENAKSRDAQSKLESDKAVNQQNLKNFQQSVYMGTQAADVLSQYNQALKDNANYDKQIKALQEQQAQAGAKLFDLFAGDDVKAARQRLTEDKYDADWGYLAPGEAVTQRDLDQQTVDQFMQSIGQQTQYYNFADTANAVLTKFGENLLGSAGNLAALGLSEADFYNSLPEDLRMLVSDPEAMSKATPEQLAQMEAYKQQFYANSGNGGRLGAMTDKAEAWADQHDAQAAEEIRKAKAGLGKFGQFGVDLASTALDVGFDAVSGLGLASMAARVMGSSVGEARRAGANTEQQIMYGLTNTAIELLTEKMTDGLGLVYGKGVPTDIAEKVINKLAKTDAGANLLRLLNAGLGEGMEEVVSDLLNPFAQWIIDENARDNRVYDVDPSELLYDFLLGSAMGLAGGVVEAATGGYAEANRKMHRNQLASDIETAKRQAVIDRSRYQEAEKYGTPEDVVRVQSEIENRPDNRSPITKARAKAAELLGKYAERDDNGNYLLAQDIPVEERLTRQEASLLVSAGLLNRNVANEISQPRGYKPEAEMTEEERRAATKKKSEHAEEYVAGYNATESHAEMEAGKISVNSPEIQAAEARRKEQAVSFVLGEDGNVDTGDTIEEEAPNEPASEAEAPKAEEPAPQPASEAKPSAPVKPHEEERVGKKSNGDEIKASIFKGKDGKWRVQFDDGLTLGEAKKFSSYKKAKEAYDKIITENDGFAEKENLRENAPESQAEIKSNVTPGKANFSVKPPAEASEQSAESATPAEESKPTEEKAPEPAKAEEESPEQRELRGLREEMAQMRELLKQFMSGTAPAQTATAESKPKEKKTKAVRNEEKAAAWREANDKLTEENMARQEADNKKLEDAKTNKTEVSFDFQKEGKDYTITWDGKSYVVIIRDADGNVAFNDDFPEIKEWLKGDKIRPGSIAKAINKLRSTLKSDRGMAPVEQTAEAEAEAEADVVEANPELIEKLQNAKSVGEMNALFFDDNTDENEFARAVEQLSGEPFNIGHPRDSIEALYDKLHPESAPTEPDAQKTPAEPEKPAEPVAPAEPVKESEPAPPPAKKETKPPKKKAKGIEVKESGAVAPAQVEADFTIDDLKAALENPDSDANAYWPKLLKAMNNGTITQDQFYELTGRKFGDGSNKSSLIDSLNKTPEERAKIAQAKANREAVKAAEEAVKQATTPEEYFRAFANVSLGDGIHGNKNSPDVMLGWLDPDSDSYDGMQEKLVEKYGEESAYDYDFTEGFAKLLAERGVKFIDAKGEDLVYRYQGLDAEQKAIVRAELEKQIKKLGKGQELTVDASQKIINSEFKKLQKAREEAKKNAKNAGSSGNISESVKQGIGSTSNANNGVGGVSAAGTELRGNTGRVRGGGVVLSSDGTTDYAMDAALDRAGVDNKTKKGKDARAIIKGIWHDDIEPYLKKGAKLLTPKQMTPGMKALSKVAKKYGVDIMSLVDASNYGDFSYGGYTHRPTWMFGPTVFTNRYIPNFKNYRQIVNRTGDSAAHEMGHQYGDEVETKTGARPKYQSGVSAVGKVAKDFATKNNASLVGAANHFHLYSIDLYVGKVKSEAAHKAAWFANGQKTVSAETRQKIEDEFKTKKSSKEKRDYIFSLFGDNKEAKSNWEAAVFEECMMEFASNGRFFTESMKANGFDPAPLQKAAREWLEKDGGVPKGFYADFAPVQELLNKEHDAWLAEQDKIRIKPETTKNSKADSGVKSDFMDVSEDGKPSPTPFSEGYANSREIYEGETEKSRSAEAREGSTPGEIAAAGGLKHGSKSNKTLNQIAKENIDRALADKNIGFDQVFAFYSNMEPSRMNTQEAVEAGYLYDLLEDERRYRVGHPGYIRNTQLPADFVRLDSCTNKALPWAPGARSEAGSILGHGKRITEEAKVKNEAAKKLFGSEHPTDTDPNSIARRLYNVIDESVELKKKIDADLQADLEQAGEDADAQKAARDKATNRMLKLLSDINNNTRSVNSMFGKATGKVMRHLEKRMLDRIVRDSPNAYDVISKMALSSIDRIAFDFDAVGTVNTIKQIRYLNMLSNAATIVNNVLNNIESATSGANAQNIGMAIAGKHANRLMGGQVVLGKNYNDALTRFNPFNKRNKELNRYALMKGAESVLGLYYGLEVEAGKYETGMGKARYNQNDTSLGRMLGTFQFLSGLGMQSTDAMAIARAERGMEMGLDELDISDARRASMVADYEHEARKQMYHATDSKFTKALETTREWMNGIPIAKDANGGIGLGDVVMPFVAVPANVAARAMRATPAGQLIGAIQYARTMHELNVRAKKYARAQELEAKQKNGGLTPEELIEYESVRNVNPPTDAEVRKAVRTIGEVVNNGMMTVLGAAATLLGGLKNFDDEDDEEAKRLAKEKGFTGLQFNPMAMLRGGEWKDGDPVIGGSWLEVMALPLAAGNTIARAAKNRDENTGAFQAALRAVVDSPISTLDDFIHVVQDAPGLSQAVDIWNAYDSLANSDDFARDFEKQMGSSLAQYGANTLSSFVIPNLYSQLGAGLDNKVRDIYHEDSNFKVARNIILNKTILGRQKFLDEAKSSLGETRTYGGNKAMGVLNRMILPGTGVQVWKQSELEKEYAALRAAGADVGKTWNVAAKASAPKYIEVNDTKYALNAAEQKAYDEAYTNAVNQWQTTLMHSDGYKDMDADAKVQAMKDVRTLAALVTSHNTLDAKKKGDNPIPADVDVNFDRWQSTYQNNPEALSKFLIGKYTFKSLWDNKEKTVTDYKAMDNYLSNVYSKLDGTARDLLDSSYSYINDMYDARSVGIDSKTFMGLKEIHKKYQDMQDYYKDVDDSPSLSSLNRDMVVEFGDYLKNNPQQAKWAQDSMKLWTTIPANLETFEKWQGKTSLNDHEIDSWFDTKDGMTPKGGYKTASQNQRLMAVRDFNGISASSQKELEAKRWDMIEREASESAWNRLKVYKDQGQTVAYALDHATYWYKDGRKWVQRHYNRIYPKS